jgi:hypothetical protein
MIASRAGYLPQRSKQAHAGQKFYLRYESPLGGQRRIEVDINFLHRVALEPVERRAVMLCCGETVRDCFRSRVTHRWVSRAACRSRRSASLLRLSGTQIAAVSSP